MNGKEQEEQKFLCLRVTKAQDIELHNDSTLCCLYIRVGNYRANSGIIKAEQHMEFSIELMMPYSLEHVIHFIVVDWTAHEILAHGRFPEQDDLSPNDSSRRICDLTELPWDGTVQLKPKGTLSLSLTVVEVPQHRIDEIHLTVLSFTSNTFLNFKKARLLVRMGEILHDTGHASADEFGTVVWNKSFSMPYSNERKLRFALEALEQAETAPYGSVVVDLWGLCAEYQEPIKGNLALINQKNEVIGKLRVKIELAYTIPQQKITADMKLPDSMRDADTPMNSMSDQLHCTLPCPTQDSPQTKQTLFKCEIQDSSSQDLLKKIQKDDTPFSIHEATTVWGSLLLETQLAALGARHTANTLRHFVEAYQTPFFIKCYQQAEDAAFTAQKSFQECHTLASQYLSQPTDSNMASLSLRLKYNVGMAARRTAETALKSAVYKHYHEHYQKYLHNKSCNSILPNPLPLFSCSRGDPFHHHSITKDISSAPQCEAQDQFPSQDLHEQPLAFQKATYFGSVDLEKNVELPPCNCFPFNKCKSS